MASLMEFKGFSDREINTLQREKKVSEPLEVVDAGSNPRQADFGKISHHKQTRGQEKQTFNAHPAPPQEGTTELPKTAFIVQQTTTNLKSEQTESNHTTIDNNTDDTTPPRDARENTTQESPLEESDEQLLDLNMDNQSRKAESNLELLQKRQRQLENENKKRKALVEQTLQERYAKSQLEAKTLHTVKEELDRLDNLLSRDVTILRSRIEEESRQYTVARLRYDSAEKEFVAAKLSLHRASESKELLSEHLCTIIQQNELLKAEKLAELLKALQLENDTNVTHHQSTISERVLFQKTPTPGINIWPHERRSSKESSISTVTSDTGFTMDTGHNKSTNEDS